MTKAENRAAAKAYHQEKLHQQDEALRAERVNADLAELRRLRNYLLFKSRTDILHRPLIDAIDDHVGRLTGDRTALHAKQSSIG